MSRTCQKPIKSSRWRNLLWWSQTRRTRKLWFRPSLTQTPPSTQRQRNTAWTCSRSDQLSEDTFGCFCVHGNRIDAITDVLVGWGEDGCCISTHRNGRMDQVFLLSKVQLFLPPSEPPPPLRSRTGPFFFFFWWILDSTNTCTQSLGCPLDEQDRETFTVGVLDLSIFTSSEF